MTRQKRSMNLCSAFITDTLLTDKTYRFRYGNTGNRFAKGSILHPQMTDCSGMIVCSKDVISIHCHMTGSSFLKRNMIIDFSWYKKSPSFSDDNLLGGFIQFIAQGNFHSARTHKARDEEFRPHLSKASLRFY